MNPAAAVRGPKHVVTKGATPVLTPAETRSLLDGIDPVSLVGLRDRALLSVMVYSFARVSAVVGMRRQDYFLQGISGAGCGCTRRAASGTTCRLITGPRRPWMRLAAGGIEGAKAPLFQSHRPVAPAERSVADAARGAGDDQAPCVGGGSSGVDVLSHVPGDGHHGVSVEWGYARARATDCRPRVAQDDEAVRPDGGHGHARRDRTHRDLTGEANAPGLGGAPVGHVVIARPYSVRRWLALAPGSSGSGSRVRLSGLNPDLVGHPAVIEHGSARPRGPDAAEITRFFTTPSFVDLQRAP